MDVDEPNYFFRGDDNYHGGPIGLPLGPDADAADIQNFADHVLRKETNRTSRFTSFTSEVKIARRFTSADDNGSLRKVRLTQLRELEAQGAIRIWDAEQVCDALQKGPKKLAKQAFDVRTAMQRNREVLVEGQVPVEFVMQVE